MKKFNKISVICIALTVVLSGLVYLKVSAEANTKQISQIRNECSSLKNTLNQLHVSDALLRVNMGQRYELMSTKLMDRFNSRAASNNFKTDILDESSNKYKSMLDVFRSDYKAYEEKMVLAIKIDCQSEPSVFYDALVSARSSRAQVYRDVVTLSQQIDDYRAAVSQFEKAYQAVGEKG